MQITRREIIKLAALGSCLSLSPQLQAEIHSRKGNIYLGHRPLGDAETIAADAAVVVPRDGQMEFTLGDDAFLIRGGSAIQFESDNNGLIQGLRLITGAILATFGRGRERRLTTRIATIGIRGTAVYLSAQSTQTYFCTCYGQMDLYAGGSHKKISAQHHDPHLISDAGGGMNISAHVAMVEHSDDEIRRLDAYVGRTPAFDTT